MPEPLLARFRSLMELRRCTIDLIGEPKLRHHPTCAHLGMLPCAQAKEKIHIIDSQPIWQSGHNGMLARKTGFPQNLEASNRVEQEGAHLWMETSTTTSGQSADIVSRSRSVASFPSSRARTAERMVVQDGCEQACQWT